MPANSTRSAGLGGTIPKRLPPYAKTLAPSPRRSLVVLTGSGAWERCASGAWFPRAKIMLPLGADPRGLEWRCTKGFGDCIIFALGNAEPNETIKQLARQLLRFFPFLLYVGPGPLVRFEMRRAAK